MMSHDEVWDRIPWLVNGRADDAEREQLEAHLRICEECRIELAVQRQVMGAIANDKRIDVVPGAAFQRLWDRISADSIIDDDDDELDDGSASARPGSSGNGMQASKRPDSSNSSEAANEPVTRQPTRQRSITRWLAAAVIVEAIGLVALTTALTSRSVEGQPSADYRTVTSPTVQAAASPGIIRAVFQPNLRMSDLQQLLEQSRLKIVLGPTEAGVYTLAASSAIDQSKVDAVLGELRSHPSVRFAEPVANESAAGSIR